MSGRTAPGAHTTDTGREPFRGTVILPFGRVFAPRIDLLTREGFKTTAAINGLSPFSAVDDPDPEMAPWAESERVTDRARADVHKDLADRLASSGADYLVVENTGALVRLREVNGRLYTLLGGEQTDLMDLLRDDDRAGNRTPPVKVRGAGLSDSLRAAYDRFVDACLASFDPSRIILVRTHAPRFWVSEDGTVALTTARRGEAQLLEHLDDHFLRRTGCLVSHAALGRPAVSPNWRGRNPRLRLAIEADLVDLVRSQGRGVGRPLAAPAGRGETAADHVAGAVRRQQPVDADRLRRYFAGGGASYDDLLALVFLQQRHPLRHRRLVRACVRLALADPGSLPVLETKQRFDRGLAALRGWPWCSPDLPTGDAWRPQVALDCGSTVLRFHGSGTITRSRTSTVATSDGAVLAEGALPITPANLLSVLGSWPFYLERARRGTTAGPRVVVRNAEALVDSCSWLDWAEVLEHERVVITTVAGAVPDGCPDAKTDLSFVFDPNVRVCTVGGGLMDQVTHIALFDELCTPNGLDYIIDDLRYTWFQSHNGFEASRLAPELEGKRLTRRVSQALLESFRAEVMKTRLPWVFNQSRTWHDFGLREALVLTRDYSNARKLVEHGAPFPVRVYTTQAEIVELMRNPPRPVVFFTSQHRTPMAPESSDQLRRVFSYRHLEDAGLGPAVASVAEDLRASPHVAVHVRRGDYLTRRFDTREWYFGWEHYVRAIDLFLDSEFGSRDFDVAVFSDDLAFVKEHWADYGLDRFSGQVRFVEGNDHFRAIYDSYLMSLCPVIIGSVGFFAATTSLLADPPSTFVRALPEGARIEWRRLT